MAISHTWRDVIKVHPAAELFPMMSETELRALSEDIKEHGIKIPIVFWAENPSHRYSLLDGRSRLDAAELAGIKITTNKRGLPTNAPYVLQYGHRDRHYPLDGEWTRTDPYEYVVTANLHRRHLTAEQKRELIAKVVKADPTKSDRAIAKTTKTDHKTVASVRAAKERRGEIPHVKTRTDTKGRKQPAKKVAAKVEPKPEPKPEPKVEPKPEPTATTSWKVEVIAKDGKRYGNGVRLQDEDEADAYRSKAATDLLGDEEDPVIVTATEVIPCDDAPSGAVMERVKRGRLKGRFTGRIFFTHGTCDTFDWEEVATPASCGDAETNPLVGAWDKAGPKQRHDFVLARKVEIMKAQQQNGWIAHGDIPPSARATATADDYPDMPECIRRTPQDVAA
jgi:hypothetical protein